MPKIVANPKTKAQIQAESDARRGVKTASYKFPLGFIDELAQLSKETGLSRPAIIMQAVHLWKDQKVQETETL
ncbi:hypothetical protein ACFBZI_07885 [Moraxella sp. ZJ142]|uniref:hypothetical protein n=1 Tax=Moraxella marmotae TaxID=3344520 RepID=UPI0035D49207